MLIFCKKCGNQLNSNAVFCPKCGTKCEAQFISQYPVQQSNLQQNELKKKSLSVKAIVALVLVFCLLVGVGIVAYKSNWFPFSNKTVSDEDEDELMGWRNAVKRIEAAYNDNNPEIIVSMICNVAKEHDDDIYDEDTAEEYWSDSIDGARDYFEEEVDSAKFNIKLDIRGNYELSGKKIKEVFKDYGYTEDDAKGVDKMVKVKAKMIGKHGKEEEKQTVTYYFIKEDGKWNLFTRKNGTLSYYYDVEEED